VPLVTEVNNYKMNLIAAVLYDPYLDFEKIENPFIKKLATYSMYKCGTPISFSSEATQLDKDQFLQFLNEELRLSRL
jgi:hypothetical protein